MATQDYGGYLQGLFDSGTINQNNTLPNQANRFVGNDNNLYSPLYYTREDNQGNALGDPYLGAVTRTPQSNLVNGQDRPGSWSDFLDPTSGNVIGQGNANFASSDPGENLTKAFLAFVSGGAASAGMGAALGSGAGGATGGGGVGSTSMGLTGSLGGTGGMGFNLAAPSMDALGATGAASYGGTGLAGFAGAAPAAAGGGSSSLLQQLATKLGLSGLSSAVSGGGSGGGSNVGGGLNLGSLTGLLGGINDAYQQGNASSTMQNWLQGQQAKIDNLYSPGSPEYNYLWDSMSRQDAAAGRNSQYGPRSVDLAAKIAQIKADETQRFTTGTSKAYADALNQNASRFSGLSAAAQKMLGGNGINLGSLSSLFSGMNSGSYNATSLGGAGLGSGAATGSDMDQMYSGPLDDFIDYGEFI